MKKHMFFERVFKNALIEGCQFTGGVYVTDDEKEVNTLIKAGKLYKVLEEDEALETEPTEIVIVDEAESQEQSADESIDVSKSKAEKPEIPERWGIEQIVQYASENGIEVPDKLVEKKRKAPILDFIEKNW